MKILVLTGSPRKNGNSMLLSDHFCASAAQAGHQLQRFDLAGMKIQGCTACEWCRNHGGQCLLQDDMQQIYPHLLEADLVVLATPLYYFGMSAQLKLAIDRFFAVNSSLFDKQAVLIGCCGDPDAAAAEALQHHFTAICDYLRWQEKGCLIAADVNDAGDVAKTDYLAAAEALAAAL